MKYLAGQRSLKGYTLTGLIADGKYAALVVTLVIFGVSWAYYFAAKGGKKFEVKKKIAAFEAIPEAVGRSTELGKPLHGSTGGSPTGGWRGPMVVAGTTLMGYVAELTAKNSMPFHVSVGYPDQIVLLDDMLGASYLKAGHPELYQHEYVHFYGDSDSSYTGGMVGFISRAKIGANFLLGGYGGESLFVAEAGNRLGAFQVAGTPAIWQLPFLVVTCDYVMLGDELFAAGCIVTGDPVETSFIAGQDLLKALFIAVTVIGTLAVTFGSDFLVKLLKM